MTFIYNVTPGELLDRMSIVARKIVELELQVRLGDYPRAFDLAIETGERAKSYLPPLLAEFDALASALIAAGRAYQKNPLLLAATNAALWQREIEIRARPSLELAITISCLNDKRRGLVRYCNIGVPAANEEPKIY